nr:RNA-binding protein 42-like isoform X2 [Ipomoea batatas]
MSLRVQAQQLFQRVAQTITPEALQNVKAALASSEIEHKAEAKKKAVPRKAAGQTWEDPTLADWPEITFYALNLRFGVKPIAGVF